MLPTEDVRALTPSEDQKSPPGPPGQPTYAGDAGTPGPMHAPQAPMRAEDISDEGSNLLAFFPISLLTLDRHQERLGPPDRNALEQNSPKSAE